jgi:hypothetical protein
MLLDQGLGILLGVTFGASCTWILQRILGYGIPVGFPPSCIGLSTFLPVKGVVHKRVCITNQSSRPY